MRSEIRSVPAHAVVVPWLLLSTARTSRIYGRLAKQTISPLEGLYRWDRDNPPFEGAGKECSRRVTADLVPRQWKRLIPLPAIQTFVQTPPWALVIHVSQVVGHKSLDETTGKS